MRTLKLLVPMARPVALWWCSLAMACKETRPCNVSSSLFQTTGVCDAFVQMFRIIQHAHVEIFGDYTPGRKDL